MTYGVGSQELNTSEFDKYARTCSACAGVGGCFALVIGPYLFSIGGYFLPFFMLSGLFSILSFVIFVSGALDGEESNRRSSLDETVGSQMEHHQLDHPVKPMPDFKFIMSIPVSIIKLTE
jgi:hypothetical protein